LRAASASNPAQRGRLQVTTVEGLARDREIHPVQQAWLEVGAMQCGFCTPGWLVETATLLARDPRPREDEVMGALERHLCRCCAYSRIQRAVRRAIELVDHLEPFSPVSAESADAAAYGWRTDPGLAAGDGGTRRWPQPAVRNSSRCWEMGS
jgi:xanthine dehydrogenase iron-sulfur cluster and FAD-binding subunit A